MPIKNKSGLSIENIILGVFIVLTIGVILVCLILVNERFVGILGAQNQIFTSIAI